MMAEVPLLSCAQVQASIEVYLDGGGADRQALDRHFAQCDRCGAALALARAVDRVLAAAPAEPPTSLSRVIMGRVRRERWRSEQQFDVVFNLAVAAVAVLVLVSVLAALYLTGLSVIVLDASALVGSGLWTLVGMRPEIVPVVGLSLGVLATGLGVWWWTERGPIL